MEDDASMRNLLAGLKKKCDSAVNMDVRSLKEKSDAERDQVVKRLIKQGPPPQFRLINCKATSEHKRVVLVDGKADVHLQDNFTAVSHTWGQDVYGVFDCECAAECPASVARGMPCPGAATHGERHREVISDILKMCDRLMFSGSEFVWHDGVCIAQHDEREVKDTIRHMGWIYSKARDTVIFLDYVGKPRALLMKPPSIPDMVGSHSMVPRWNGRVWTLQEAVLSKRRRYCIRSCAVPVATDGSGSSVMLRWKALREMVIACDEDDSYTAVVEEEELWAEFVSLLKLTSSVWLEAREDPIIKGEPEFRLLISETMFWCGSLGMLYDYFELVFSFPSLQDALEICGTSRDSKHKGDRINSVLGLAGITDFVAPKDSNLEASTIEFVKRLGQKALRNVLFWVNVIGPPTSADKVDEKVHTWLPCLSRAFHSVREDESAPQALGDVECEVLESGMLQLTGRLCCVAVRFNLVAEAETLKDREQVHKAYCMDSEGAVCMQLLLRLFSPQPWSMFGAHLVANSRVAGFAMLTARGYMESRTPVIQGREMKAGDTLSAHLVTTAASASHTRMYLLVQANDLRSPVCRLGAFKARGPHMVSALMDAPSLTWLDRLVIN